jgi:hypothetical protein
VTEADAPPLVTPEVDHHATALLGDAGERGVQLGATVAAQRAEDVAGEALAVHPHQHRLGPGDVALDERHVFGAVEQGLGRRGRRRSPTGSAPGPHRWLDHQLLVLTTVADQVGDRDDQQAVLGGEDGQLRDPGHRAVVVDDLAQHAGRLEPREAGEVDRGLGVPSPLEHPPVASPQREDVAGPVEVAPGHRRIGRGPGWWRCGHRRRCPSWCRAGSRP